MVTMVCLLQTRNGKSSRAPTLNSLEDREANETPRLNKPMA